MEKIDSLLKGIKKSKLQLLLQVIPSIIRESNIEKLLQKILHNATIVMEAERSSIFIYDKDNNELWTFVTEGDLNKEIRISAEKGIVGEVIKTGSTILLKDAYDDDRFEKSVDIQTGFRTKSLLAMPITGRSHNILGVIEVLNKKSGRKIFTLKDTKILDAFGSLVAISLENSMQMIDLQTNYESLARYSHSLERYIGPHIIDILKSGKDPTSVPAKIEKRGVLFCDIRDFTQTTKALSTEETVSYLNNFFELVHRAITDNEGHIEKLIGDSVMASFTSSDAAYECALQFNSYVKGSDSIKCGIGLTYGEILVGNIGSEHKLDYTLIGDIVNLASRLEKLTKKTEQNILFPAEFYENLSAQHKNTSKLIGRVKIRGLNTSVKIYGT